MFGVGGVPCVKIGLPAGQRTGRGRRARSGTRRRGEARRRPIQAAWVSGRTAARPEPAEQVPGGELAQEPLVGVTFGCGSRWVARSQSAAAVCRWRAARRRPSRSQVGDGPPVRELVERLVGEGGVARGQAGEQGRTCAPASHIEPFHGPGMAEGSARGRSTRRSGRCRHPGQRRACRRGYTAGKACRRAAAPRNRTGRRRNRG